MTFFDRVHNRLVMFEQGATAEFWDALWNVDDLKKDIMSIRDGVYVQNFTKKYLAPGSKILEGGCGTGHYVYALRRWGYDVLGIDYAEETIKKIRSVFPDMPVEVGDVRSLRFPDGSFDGYWSFGVIEHFYEGFEPIALEMARVLRPGGKLFITFPHMSLLRRLKAVLGLYKPLDETQVDLKNFYQFCLDEKEVVKTMESVGFTLKEKYKFDGVKGLKDEVSWLRPVLQKIYRSNSFVMKAFRFALDRLVRFFSSHIILLVLEKK